MAGGWVLGWHAVACGAEPASGVAEPARSAPQVAEPVPQVAEPASGPTRERPREFLDSLSDTTLTNDTQQIYRQNGRRREVDLGAGWIIALDEREAPVLSSTSGSPDNAVRPGRMLGLVLRRPAVGADLWYERGATENLWWLSGERQLDEAWTLSGSSHDLRSNLDDWPGLGPTELRRQDHWAGLRWRSPGRGQSSEFGLRQSRLSPGPESALAPAGRSTQALWRWRWQDTAPGWSVATELSHPVGPRSEVADVDGPRLAVELGRQLGPAGWWPGARLYWQEAPWTSLLTEDSLLTRNAAWHRTVGVELPYGRAPELSAAEPQAAGAATPHFQSVPGDTRSISAGWGTGGAFYSQWRQHSLADHADRLWLLGWRHGWAMPQRWRLETRVEQAMPLAGDTPLRSLQLGERLSFGDFPRRSVSTDLTLVRADTSDSAYLALKQTERLADDWLGVLVFSAQRKQPHGEPDAGLNDARIALAAGWRDPEERRLHILGRYTLALRGADSAYRDPATGDRQAHILLGYLSVLADPATTWTLRATTRLDHDQALGAGSPRRTSMLLGRATVDGAGRLSLSAHLARRTDTIDGPASSYGAELGLRLSRLAVLALGFNPRGFADNELAVDEQPRKGWTLRLRFTIEGAIGRWLDAGRNTPLGHPRAAPPPLADLLSVPGEASLP